MKKTIWLNFDLGVRGDYEGLYTWLDHKKAKDCGNNSAVFTYEYSVDLIQSLKEELENSVDLTKKSRIYIIYKDTEKESMKGAFIEGGRKAPQWSGFAEQEMIVEDVGI